MTVGDLAESEGEPPSPELLLRRLGSFELRQWSVPAHNRWLSAGVFLVELSGGRRAVLKHLSSEPPAGETDWEAHWSRRSSEPRHWNYWRREALCYRSGLSQCYRDSGIFAPGLLALDENEKDAVLLIERVSGRPGESWDLGSYRRAAQCLGRAQGSWAGGDWETGHEWLSQGFLHDYSAEKPVAWELLQSDEAWSHPLARECFPPGLREAASLLHEERERLWAIGESLPRTLCHLDFWPKNLFEQEGGFSLIDWSFAGGGAVGEDPGNLVPDSVADHFIPASQLAALEAAVFEGYLAGLRQAGWQEDPELVRLGMWASAVKYDWLMPFTLAQLEDARQRAYGGGPEVDARFRFRERGAVLAHLSRWAASALALADRLGI